MVELNPFRTEIEQILRTHTRTRYAKVFLGMERGLTDEQMAEDAELAGEHVEPVRIAYVRETVRMTLAGEAAAGTTRAKSQAGLYRELFNYSMSPGLRQHAKTCLTQLQQIDLGISSEPLGDVHLGANDQPNLGKPEQQCKKCFMVHNGECL
jgi:hypothetical protein